MTYSRREIRQIVAETLLPFASVGDVARRSGVREDLLTEYRQDFLAGKMHLDPESEKILCVERMKVLMAATNCLDPDKVTLFRERYLVDETKAQIGVMARHVGFRRTRAYNEMMRECREKVFAELRACGIQLQTRIWRGADSEGNPNPFAARYRRTLQASEGERRKASRLAAFAGVSEEEMLRAYERAQAHGKTQIHDVPAIEGLRRIDIPMAAVTSCASGRSVDSILRRVTPGIVSLLVTPDGRPIFLRGSGMTQQEEAIEARFFRAGRITAQEFDARAGMRTRVLMHLEHALSERKTPQEKLDEPYGREKPKTNFQHVIDGLMADRTREVLLSALNPALMAAIRDARPMDDPLKVYRILSHAVTPMRGRTRPMSLDRPDADSIERICAERPLDRIAEQASQHPWIIGNLMRRFMTHRQIRPSVEAVLRTRDADDSMIDLLRRRDHGIDFGDIPVLRVGPYAHPGMRASTTEGWRKFASCIETIESFPGHSEERRHDIREALIDADIDWDDPRIDPDPLYPTEMTSLAEYLSSVSGRDIDEGVDLPVAPGQDDPMLRMA